MLSSLHTGRETRFRTVREEGPGEHQVHPRQKVRKGCHKPRRVAAFQVSLFPSISP